MWCSTISGFLAGKENSKPPRILHTTCSLLESSNRPDEIKATDALGHQNCPSCRDVLQQDHPFLVLMHSCRGSATTRSCSKLCQGWYWVTEGSTYKCSMSTMVLAVALLTAPRIDKMN